MILLQFKPITEEIYASISEIDTGVLALDGWSYDRETLERFYPKSIIIGPFEFTFTGNEMADDNAIEILAISLYKGEVS